MMSRYGFVVLVGVFCSSSLYGESISGLFNTGVDDSGRRLLDNEVDPHYNLIEPSDIVGNAFTYVIGVSEWGSEGWIPGWLGDGRRSAWISPTENTMAPGEIDISYPNYRYRTTFDLSGLDVSSVEIIGRWAVDNWGTDILLNGESTGISLTTEVPYSRFHDFVISSELGHQFVVGENTLDFLVNNALGAPSPTGLRVEIDSATANVADFLPGDANYDYVFNQLDIVEVLLAGKYMTDLTATWEEGDYNGDNLFNQLDVVAMLNSGNYMGGRYAAIPEPSGLILFFIGLISLFLVRRNK